MRTTEIEKVKETVKKMQVVIYEIMCDIDDFCKENRIRYYLSGGTCLGAVRHHGFIPWDDDGDLMMPRKDYERFLSTFPRRYSNKYGVGAFSLDEKWKRPYARVWNRKTIWRSTNIDDVTMGVFIDLFPIDGLPKGRFSQSIFYMQIKLLSAMGSASVKKHFLEGEKYRFVKRILGALLKPLGMRYFSVYMEKLAKKYNYDTSKYVGVSMAAHYGSRETVRKETMGDPVYLQFEDREFPVPQNYVTYLSNLYGDYMTIPEDAEKNGYSHLDHWSVVFLNE